MCHSLVVCGDGIPCASDLKPRKMLDNFVLLCQRKLEVFRHNQQKQMHRVLKLQGSDWDIWEC